MIYTKFIPLLFSLVFTVGVFLLGNGLAGLVFNKSYAPEKDSNNKTVFRVIGGADAANWGKICLGGSIPFFAAAIFGFYVLLGFYNSPAYLVNLVKPPVEGEILYSVKKNEQIEIAYGFQGNARVIQQKYKEKLESGGWQLINEDLISLRFEKGNEILHINFIGLQMGDSRLYPTKAVLILTAK